MSEKSVTEKVCMVTGANSGIGKATALNLAQRGARVVMVCRNHERGNPARAEIIQRSGNAQVDVLTADFASQQEVRLLAAAFKEQYDRLDVLINNAGLSRMTYTETEDGYETTWAVNHLAPFLLTNLLLDVIRASAPARIVNVSSESHQGSRIRFDDPNLTGRYGWFKAYAQSKLANVLFTYELARRLDGTGVTATVMHPGVVATNIWNRSNTPLDYVMRVIKVFFMSTRKSGDAVARLAVSPALEGVTGQYFNVMKPARSTPLSYDEEVAQRLWGLSEEMTGLA